MEKNDGNKEARLGEDGSTMLWSLMILTFLLILSVTFMSMGAVSLTKAKKEAAYKQAFYTSKGAVDAVAAALFTGTSEEAANPLTAVVEEAAVSGEDYESCGEDPKEWDPVEGIPEGMGECRVRICYRAETGTLLISARTRKGEVQRIVTLELEQLNMDEPGTEEDIRAEEKDSRGLVWSPRRYTEGG